MVTSTHGDGEAALGNKIDDIGKKEQMQSLTPVDR